MLVAYKTLQSMHCRKKDKKGALALKLDISKAYDRVEWAFLEKIMYKLGFLEAWIERVMSCVSTPSFSVRINDKAYGNIIPTRRLRQRGPSIAIVVPTLCRKVYSFTDKSKRGRKVAWSFTLQESS